MARLAQGAVRVVLAAWEQPDGDGLELARRVRACEGIGFVYVMLTAAAGTEVASLQAAVDAGAADVLSEPVAGPALAARLSAAQHLLDLEADLTRTRGQLKARQARVDADNRRLAIANEQLSRLATTDELTGLPNRRAARARLTESWAFSARHGTPLSCVLIDIDHFKQFNDTYGHAVGDIVLRETARQLRGFARAEDVVCRIGGEEFLVLCPHTSVERAAEVAERHRRVIANASVEHEGSRLSVSISAGVAERHEDMAGVEDLLTATDRALYAAKQIGRNRVHAERSAPGAPVPNLWERREYDETHADHGDAGAVALMADDPAAMDMCRALLQSAGYRLDDAWSDVEGLARIGHRGPDIVVVNESAGLDGPALVRHLKQNPATAAIPVLMLGARTGKDALEAAIACGADEYVNRPLRPQDLLLRVRSLCLLGHSRSELARSNEIRSEQARMLTLVLDYSRTLAATEELDPVLEHTIAVTAELTFSRRVSIMLPDATRQHLQVAKAIGIDPEEVPHIRVPIGSGTAGRVFATRRSAIINSPDQVTANKASYSSRFYASVPMVSSVSGASQPVIGVLNVSDRYAGHPFEPRELEFIDLISNIAAAAIHEIQIREARDEARRSAVTALVNLAEQRDGATRQHIDRVTHFCMMLARQLRTMPPHDERIDDAFLSNLERAVPLHDVGKVAIPDDILLKPGKLTEHELAVMRSDVDVGRETIRTLIDPASDVAFLRMAEEVAGGHHEWFDGSGYPQGLSGERIPLSARVAAVARCL